MGAGGRRSVSVGAGSWRRRWDRRSAQTSALSHRDPCPPIPVVARCAVCPKSRAQMSGAICFKAALCVPSSGSWALRHHELRRPDPLHRPGGLRLLGLRRPQAAQWVVYVGSGEHRAGATRRSRRTASGPGDPMGSCTWAPSSTGLGRPDGLRPPGFLWPDRLRRPHRALVSPGLMRSSGPGASPSAPATPRALATGPASRRPDGRSPERRGPGDPIGCEFRPHVPGGRPTAAAPCSLAAPWDAKGSDGPTSADGPWPLFPVLRAPGEEAGLAVPMLSGRGTAEVGDFEPGLTAAPPCAPAPISLPSCCVPPASLSGPAPR